MKTIRIILSPFSLLYGIIMAARNLLFDAGILRSHTLPPWVISIGNLSTGGTGKSPHIEYIARLMVKLSEENENLKITYKNSAVLSRGYGRETKGFLLVHGVSVANEAGDEPLQLRRKMNDITIAVDENRVRGIGTLINLNRQLRLVLLDDAFQHRYVKPAVSILLTNFNAPFYEDHLLPYGSLREWKTGYKRADIIIVTSSPAALPEADKKQIIKKIAPAPNQKVFFSSIIYGEPANVYKDNFGAPVLNDELSVLLLTGIANPSALKKYLSEKVKEVLTFPFKDHHNYSPKDIAKVVAAFRKIDNPNKVIITTEKDSVRLDQVETKEGFGGAPVFFIPISVNVHEEKELGNEIVKHLANTTLFNPMQKSEIKLQKLA